MLAHTHTMLKLEIKRNMIETPNEQVAKLLSSPPLTDLFLLRSARTCSRLFAWQDACCSCPTGCAGEQMKSKWRANVHVIQDAQENKQRRWHLRERDRFASFLQ
jgi:hypothetical protein